MEHHDGLPADGQPSAPAAPGSLVEKIERARQELLDLTTRNRLLHTPRSGRVRTVEVIDELARAMYQTLVLDKKRFTFAPGRTDPSALDDESAEDAQHGAEAGASRSATPSLDNAPAPGERSGGASAASAQPPVARPDAQPDAPAAPRSAPAVASQSTRAADHDEDELLLAEPVAEPERDALIGQPDLELDEHGRVLAHWDSHLSTRLTSAGLQKRLLDLYSDARTLLEEQGVNVLYLAIGYLKWRAAGTPQTDRYAPLVLVPVVLERSNAGEKFHLKWSGDDIQANLSLQLLLQREHQLRLPEIEDFESLDIDAYFAQVQAMIQGQADWAVQPDDAVLGLFSFAKFMMYHDLDPAQWRGIGGLDARRSLRGVVADGFPGAVLSGQDADVDALIPPEQMLHVVDCDSSQSLVVHDARQGRDILVQGPPGTGKSQTIANIIAAAIADKKKVLFVAEKMAALEVVKRRLDLAQVGVACLELHSNKANKRALLHELRQTWQAAAPKPADERAVLRQLTQRRDELNAHAERLHLPLEPSRLTAYQVFGQLVRLRRLGHVTERLALVDPIAWDNEDRAERVALVQDLVERIERMGLPREHAWTGVGNDSLLPNERDRLIDSLAELQQRLQAWREDADGLHAVLELPAPAQLSALHAGLHRAHALAAAPAIGAAALAAPDWDSAGTTEAVLDALRSLRQHRSQAEAVAEASALDEDWQPTQSALQALLPDFSIGGELKRLAELHDTLNRLQADLVRLAQLLGEKSPLSFETAQRLAAIAERATTVPSLERDALVAHVWEQGVERVEELVDAVERVQAARAGLASVFRDNAWAQDLEPARLQLASRGGSLLRFLSAPWRRADREVRAYLVDPKLPGEELLSALDTLLDAQAAERRLAERDGEGRQAFGGAWARERSNAAFLRGVTGWMRTLRPLGAGARERLADIADPEQAAQIATRLRPALDALQRDVAPVHEALIAGERTPWGGETVLRRVPLLVLWTRTAPWRAAWQQLQRLRQADSLTLAEAGKAIETLRAAQAAAAALDTAAPAGARAFGAAWRGADSPLPELESALRWLRQHPELRVLAARLDQPRAALARAEQSLAAAQALEQDLQGLFFTLQWAGPDGAPRVAADLPLDELAERLRRWREYPEGLPEWVAYVAQAKKAQQLGLGALAEAMADGRVPGERALGQFELAYYEAVLRALVERDPRLAAFDGQKQSQLVAEFGQLDRERMELAKRQALAAHHDGIPQAGGAAGPTRVLRGEMEKKKGHLPIRQLMQRCAPAIQALKPVFMMSPLSVAQFLPAGALEFDLLIIDEASQVQPVDAFGAIARAKQLVIVGDERQLPPTQFFAKTLSGEDSAQDEDGAQAADVESILGLCRAQGLPERMLEWHYRSRHQSLIAVSNREFYQERLKIVPSPYTSEAGVGLRFHHLPEAVYDRGGKRTNAVEARAVARAVIAHAQATPQLSLGVAAFSTQQRRAIQDELELLRRQHPETEGFFNERPDEPFFVKNLENIQGDERDVVFISIGYGRDAQGQVWMDFGPVGREGGERRLNVLISRAKTRCEVFSSITDEDIALERAKGKGTAALKLFLHYARTGRLELRGNDPDRDRRVFEEQVAAALRERGHDLHTDVGIAGFFVDLAVADPATPGRYLLGVEFDGPSYRQARSARDRDRLREGALRDKGWRVHRIWIHDWFNRPQAELDRLLQAIQAAREEPAEFAPPAAPRPRAVPVEVETSEHGAVAQVGLAPLEAVQRAEQAALAAQAQAYAEADFQVPSAQYELHALPPQRMAEVVERVVQIEGPVHRTEVVARIRELWGLQRSGGRIQAAVDAGIEHACAREAVALEDQHFLAIPGRAPAIRDRSRTRSSALRRPDYLPPSEIGAAIVELVRDNLGATPDEAVQAVARRFGYRSTSAQLRALIEDRCAQLLAQGVLKSHHGVLALASPQD